MSEYNSPKVSTLRELLERGPYPGEDFFRMQVTGNGSTYWTNVSPAELARVVLVVEGGPVTVPPERV